MWSILEQNKNARLNLYSIYILGQRTALPTPQEMRLMAKVARLYYEQNYKQSHIAAHLNISQATISRLLKRAEREKIVRITVNVPQGFYAEWEQLIEEHYGVHEVIIADCSDDSALSIQHAIGSAAAYYLETTLSKHDVIGISSWSSTLLKMVEAMNTRQRQLDTRIVQILGGVGVPSAEVHATLLTQRLASILGGEAIFLPAPGVVGSAEAREVLLQDQFVQPALSLFSEISVALVGIGAIEPSKLLADSGNIFSHDELHQLQQVGAVGDICLRFFDPNGKPTHTPLEDRVIGIALEELKQVDRTIAVAGGLRKLAAIRGALRGGLIKVLITDRFTAEELAKEIS